VTQAAIVEDDPEGILAEFTEIGGDVPREEVLQIIVRAPTPLLSPFLHFAHAERNLGRSEIANLDGSERRVLHELAPFKVNAVKRTSRPVVPYLRAPLEHRVRQECLETRTSAPERETNMAEKTLNDAFYETLRDVLYAEKQALKACKKSAKAATNQELKQAFEQHGQETEGQIDRLQQIFELINRPARAKTCEAMQGIMSEMEEDLADFGTTAAADAVIIGCGQAIEHYEIARYGTLISWAKQLGQADAAKLLAETLEQEKAADALLSKIALQSVNAAGAKPKAA
jgi:ferritin-like metal-binding protein YciE